GFPTTGTALSYSGRARLPGKGLRLLSLLCVLVGATHPSVFFSASDVPALRQAAQTTHASIASHYTSLLDQHLGDPTPSATEYDDFRFLGNQVAVWAFGYQLTG